MKTCKDCIYAPMCRNCNEYVYNKGRCEQFKDKSKFIELPCPIGETVYMISTGHDDWTGYDFKLIIQASFRLDMLKKFNKTYFLTREEAEKKLEELNG